MNINDLLKESWEIAESKGWGRDDGRTFAEEIALIHSELSEALEEYRNGMEKHIVYYDMNNIHKPLGIPIELADVVIRIAIMCAKYGIDLERAIALKNTYNKTRPYKHGGKKI